MAVRYFAYGSNLLLARLGERAPSARRIGRGRLSAHQLCWHKRGTLDGSGKCNAFMTGDTADVVWGALFELADTERARLDAAEGLGVAARGASPAAFERRCIPPGCVTPRSNTAGILPRRALPDGRIATLGATQDLHDGLLGYRGTQVLIETAGGVLSAFAYVATPDALDDTLAPFTWYRDLVMAGARESRLPDRYIRTLVDVTAIADPDEERARRHRRLLGVAADEFAGASRSTRHAAIRPFARSMSRRWE